MSILDSYRRWKKIFWSLKSYEKRFELLEMGVENLSASVFSELGSPIQYKGFLKQKEFSAYSQNGEDGLLLYIFSEIGTTNKTTIEFGIGNGKQCNSANLILNFGWQSLLIEGNKSGTEAADKYYNSHPSTRNNQVKIVNAFITKDNINELFSSSGVTGEIDLLSVDIDGNDYWVWEAIEVVQPRVVVIEYNASLGPERSVSVNYDPSFYRYDKHPSGWYHGASLKALTKLGSAKGYKLIGCDSYGVNAFFIRSDIKTNTLKEIEPDEAYYAEKKRSKTHSTHDQFELIKHLPFSEI